MLLLSFHNGRNALVVQTPATVPDLTFLKHPVCDEPDFPLNPHGLAVKLVCLGADIHCDCPDATPAAMHRFTASGSNSTTNALETCCLKISSNNIVESAELPPPTLSPTSISTIGPTDAIGRPTHRLCWRNQIT